VQISHFYSIKKNYRQRCTSNGIPHNQDYPSSSLPRMVSQLKLFLETPVSSVELFSQLMTQENTLDILTASSEAELNLLAFKELETDRPCARKL